MLQNSALLIGAVTIGLVALIVVTVTCDAETTQEIGASVALVATVSLFIALLAKRVTDPTMNSAKVKRRAENVEAAATTVGLPALVMTTGAQLPNWSYGLLLISCFVLAATFATSRT